MPKRDTTGVGVGVLFFLKKREPVSDLAASTALTEEDGGVGGD